MPGHTLKEKAKKAARRKMVEKAIKKIKDAKK